jgi:HAMP domain-containing protein
MKSIRSRLVAGLALIILFFLAQLAIVYNGLQDARTDVVVGTTKNTIAASQLSELSLLAQQVRRYEKEYFVYVTNPERRNNYIKEWTGTSDKITKLIQTMRTNSDGAFSQDDVAKMSNWTSAADFYSAEMKKVFASVDERTAKVAAAVAEPAPESAVTAPVKPVSKTAPAPVVAAQAAAPAPAMYSSIEVNGMITAGKDRLSGSLVKGVSDMSAAKTKATLELHELAQDEFNEVLYAVLGTVAIGVLIAALLMWKLPSSVTTPLAALSKSVDEMSKGNLDLKISSGGVVEFEGMAKALERLRLGQQALVQRMRSR